MLAVALLLMLSSCEKEDLNLEEGDYLIFGETYGFCHGNCVHLFKIKGGEIFPDNIDKLHAEDISFQSTPLPFDKYQIASQLVDDFPQHLLENPNETFGCPDCTDQGRIYFELKQNRKVKVWQIDPFSHTQPEEIRDYIKTLQEVMAQVR